MPPQPTSARPHLRLVPDDPGLTIDCGVCVARDTDTCDDCMVSYLVDHEVGTPIILDAEETRAVELLAEAGLVPASRFAPAPGVA